MAVRHLVARTAAVIAVACGASVAPLAAQNPDPQCFARIQGGDACQRAVDLFSYMTPQLGTLIAGGNATLGQTSVLGGLGHFAIGVRANVTRDFYVPTLDGQDLDTGPVRHGSFQTDRFPAGFPVLDGALGIFGGVPLGVTRVGGVDALVNLFYIPEQVLPDGSDDGDLAVRLPSGGYEIGWGVRVGLLGETPIVPGVSLTYIRRGLPTLDLELNSLAETTSPGSGIRDSLAIRGLSLRTSSWRIVAGKKLAILSIAAGYGKDRYSGESTVSYFVADDDGTSVNGSLDFESTTTASNMFVDVTLNLGGLHLVGEIGRVKRSGVSTYNAFDAPGDGSVGYAAVGIRIGH